MKIKCVITDDEPIARKGLRGYIEKTDFLTLTGECENPATERAVEKRTARVAVYGHRNALHQRH